MSDQRKLFKRLLNSEDYLLQKESSDQVVDIDSDSKYGVRKYKSIYLKSILKGSKSKSTDYIFYKNELNNCFKLPSFNLRYSMARDEFEKYDNIEVFRNFVSGRYENSFDEKYNNLFKVILSKDLSDLVKKSYTSAKNYDGVDRHYIESVFDLNINGFMIEKEHFSIELHCRYGYKDTESLFLSKSKTNNASIVINVDFKKAKPFNEVDFLNLIYFEIMNCDSILSSEEISAVGLIKQINMDGVSVSQSSSRTYFGRGFLNNLNI